MCVTYGKKEVIEKQRNRKTECREIGEKETHWPGTTFAYEKWYLSITYLAYPKCEHLIQSNYRARYPLAIYTA